MWLVDTQGQLQQQPEQLSTASPGLLLHLLWNLWLAQQGHWYSTNTLHTQQGRCTVPELLTLCWWMDQGPPGWIQICWTSA